MKHATPLTDSQREQRYLAQTGAKVLTPRQQRWANKKANRAALADELRHQQAGFNAEQVRLIPAVSAA